MTVVEIMIGFMVVLLITASSLVAYLVRATRKGKKRNKPPVPPAESLAPAESSADVPPTKESLDLDRVSSRAPASAVQPPGPMSARPGDVLLLQVWQDREGVLVVEVGGNRYRRLFDIRDGEVGRRVLETINRLVVFSKGDVLSPLREPAPASPVGVPAPEEIVADEPQALLEQLQQQSVQAKKTRISADPVPFRRRSVAAFAGIMLNLADEIEKLLQIRVKASPELSRRYIHVTSAPDGGLRFEVDAACYDTLDEVADLQVQALIRAVISDWEARQ